MRGGGRASSDAIQGGEGNDFINSGDTLDVNFRFSPGDCWSLPGRDHVYAQQSRKDAGEIAHICATKVLTSSRSKPTCSPAIGSVRVVGATTVYMCQ